MVFKGEGSVRKQKGQKKKTKVGKLLSFGDRGREENPENRLRRGTAHFTLIYRLKGGKT